MSEEPLIQPPDNEPTEQDLQKIYEVATRSARSFVEDGEHIGEADHTRHGFEGEEIPAYYKANAAGAKAGALVAGSWLHEQKQTAEQEKDEAEYRATHDSLTGLYNQNRFKELLRERVRQAEGEEETFGLLIMDLDGFKQINDKFGHSQGDETLKNVGLKLQQVLRSNDIAMHVGRVGGDEFAFIVEGLSSQLDLENQQRRNMRLTPTERLRIVADKILAEMEGVFDELPTEVSNQLRSQVGTSIGESLWKPGKTDEAMYEEADEKMLRNKKLQKRGR